VRDLWTSFDLPVLVELVDLLEVQASYRVDTPLTVAGLTEAQVQAALRRLDAAGYLVGVKSDAPYPVVVVGVTRRPCVPSARGRRRRRSSTGCLRGSPSWPRRLRRRKNAVASRILGVVGSVGRDVLVTAAGSALGSGVTGF